MPIIVSGSGGQTVISGSNSAGYQIISGSAPVVLSGSTVTLNSAGANALHIDSTGKTGIGTTSPAYTLHVAGAGAGDGVRLDDGDLKITGDQKSIWMGAGNDLQISHDGTDTIINNQTGDLKIQNYKNGASGDIVLQTRSDGSTYHNNALVVQHDGKVGIGVTDPDTTLHVDSEILISGSSPKLRLRSTTVADESYCYIWAPSKYETRIVGGYIVSLSPTSYLGITPEVIANTDKFQIYSLTSEYPDLEIKNSAYSASGSLLTFMKARYNSGNMPATGSDVAGIIRWRGFDDRGSTSYYRTYAAITGTIADPTNSSLDGRLSFMVTNNNTETEIMTMVSGNVGIGTASPSTTLTVSGSIAMTGSLLVSGSATIIGGEAQAATLTLSADQGDDAADTTTISVADGGDLTVDCAGYIVLNTDGGAVSIYDDTAPHFTFDCDNTRLTIYDDQDIGDYFRIKVAQHGKTTISTVDDDADNADLYFDVDGDIELDTESGRVAINNGGSSAFDFETTSGSFKIWTRPKPGTTGGIASGHSAWASLKVAGSGSTTLTTHDSVGANANLTFDVDGDINLDAGAANINFKHGGTALLSVNLDSTASASPHVDFQHSRGATLGDTKAAIRFQTGDGVFNAASVDNGAYGGWSFKKTMTAISGSDLNLSSMHVTSAMGYSGGIFKLTQTQASNGGASVATITLPTAVNANQAYQLMGYNFRAMIVDSNVGSIKIARGDETNDYLFGYINDASSNGTPGAISFDGTGPSGAGKDFLYFSGSQCVIGDYIDIVCVSATAGLMKWVVTGMANT